MTELREKFKRQIEEIKKSLFGLDEVIKIFILSKVSDLTVLMLGEHAIAKSSLARVWSITMGMDFRIVTSSEVDEALIAYIDPAIFREKNIVQMRRGELMTKDHILVDEFFLWSNKFRAKLHQLLEEHTYAGLDVLTKTYTFATNPLTEHYSGQIEERNLATEDRIDLLLPMYQPKVVPTQLMIKKFGIKGRKEVELSKVIDWTDYLEARQEIMKIEIPSDILVWLTLFAESMSACKYSDSKFDISRARMHTLCAECNQKEHLCAKVALSKPRFLRATILLAKALAWFDEREEISEEDIFMAIKYTLPHRIIFLKEERTIFEAERALPDLVQQFIDDFNNWESRRIFQRLEDIITKAKDPKEPIFDNAASNELLNETSEHLAINNYLTEAIERVKEAVKKKYREILMQSSGNLEDMKTILGKSGLDLYEKGQILEEIIGQNPNLTFYYPIDRRDETALGNLINALRKIHKEQGDLTIKTKTRLMKQFKKEITFASDLLIIKEERGKVKITTATPDLKKKLESYLQQEIKDEEG